jgi:hypothetical protein
MSVGMPFEYFALSLASIFGTVSILRGPIGRALALRIQGQRALDDPGARELAELRERVASLEESQAQMADLQERLDFAERILAQQPPRAPELPG